MSRTRKDTKKHREMLADRFNTIPMCIGNIPSWFKKIESRKLKRKEKRALREGKEFPQNKRTNEWEWY